jgi:hypothetical protein
LCQLLLFRMHLMLVFWYLLIALQPSILYLIFQVMTARSKTDFHNLSSVAKIIMVAGILSMQLFYISY